MVYTLPLVKDHIVSRQEGVPQYSVVCSQQQPKTIVAPRRSWTSVGPGRISLRF
ncbi:hypothetical protein COCSUDRAFT_33804 [Coccomyxa subellipsoidea C-169]|uniref:Uncharacterized protein n=1 Tax=Coccomyxa subellipsoidea (strain C-169) TaxID=574566 RepID=I0YRW8_COCSC|nr:hypothetical protein COCSUDRAFT_33804 [Coccomyxa subellipsoidea C-169]EIE21137.1 hypothetical protein COCSUDRAFT_33804 [Coccomyxa subellipsoidea C-169]|eukprot:XP_005645681.1 hypothetical protein COCSUDRAFT_33804 [Coccomyxa subellipsoidea C-169]